MEIEALYGLALFFCLVISSSEGKTEIGDYIVDYSACNSVPVQGVSSYSCKIRCSAEDDMNRSMTGLYDMLIQMSEELRITKQELEAMRTRQLETEKELNATKEILKIDVAFNAQIEGKVPFSADEKIIFTNVLSNVGNSYNSTTGIFTVPRNGTYQFTIMSMITSGIHYVFITVNGERLSVAYGDSSFGTGTTTLNRKLVVGDEVWVESSGSHTYHAGYNVFSGNILKADF